MATRSLIASTREEAVTMLAKRAAVGRYARAEKASDPIAYVFDYIKTAGAMDWIKNHPNIAYPAIGAAGGAALGGLTDMAKADEDRTPWSSMATGALAGGGLGFGGALLSGNPTVKKYLSGLSPESVGEKMDSTIQGVKDYFKSPSESGAPAAINSDAATAAPAAASSAASPANDGLPAWGNPSHAPKNRVLAELGAKHNLFSLDDYNNADFDTQNAMLQRVGDELLREPGGSVVNAAGTALNQNKGLIAGGAAAHAGVNALGALKNLPHGNADFLAGIGDVKGLSPEMVAGIQAMPQRQTAGLSRAGRGWNYLRQTPAYTLPGRPAVPGSPAVGLAGEAGFKPAIPGKPAVPPEVLSRMSTAQAARSGRRLRTTGVTKGLAGKAAKLGIWATVIGSLFYDGAGAFQNDAAKKFVESTLKLTNGDVSRTQQIVGKHVWDRARGAQ